MLRKECTQGPRCLGFPSGPFPLHCTHLFYSHPSLPASVYDTCTQNQPQTPNPISSNTPISPLLKSHPGFCSPFPCLGIWISRNLDGLRSTPRLSPLREAAQGEPRVPLR